MRIYSRCVTQPAELGTLILYHYLYYITIDKAFQLEMLPPFCILLSLNPSQGGRYTKLRISLPTIYYYIL